MIKIHKYIKFTGVYTELKNMGYTFQKLYASNYMQWCHDDTGIRVWKKGADVTIDAVVNYTGQFLEVLLNGGLTLKTSSFFPNSEPYAVVYTNRDTRELTGDDTGYFNQMKAFADASKAGDDAAFDSLPYDWESHVISLNLMRKLGELNKLGWIEVADMEYDDGK